MGTLHVLSQAGDQHVTWDALAAQTGDPAALAMRQEAERLFATVHARRGGAFRTTLGQPAERIEQFDPSAERIVLIPPVVGG
jgi:hypothetical protein